MKFLDELKVVESTVSNRATFENTKETVFSSFRRACLDLKSAPELLDSPECTPHMRHSAWYMLLELSKSKLRRKHTAEVAAMLLQSTAWRSTLEADEVLHAQLRQLPEEFRSSLTLLKFPDQADDGSPRSRKNKKQKSPTATSLVAARSPPPLPAVAAGSATLPVAPVAAVVPVIAPAVPVAAPVAPVLYVQEPTGTNPFSKGNRSVRCVDPSIEKWWEDPVGGPDYQKIFLVHKTAQLQQMQTRILSQQREILQKK